MLTGLQKAFPQYIDRVFTATDAAKEEGLAGGFSFVVEGTWGNMLNRTLPQGGYVLRSDDPAYHAYRAMHGHHPDKGIKPPFIAFGPDVQPGVCIEQASMLDICPTLAALAGVDMPHMTGKPLPILR